MKNIQLHSNRYKADALPEFSQTVCSSNDCTGLEPRPSYLEEEIESFEEIYPFLPSKYVSNPSDMP